jgi:pimeloyl-ACP methyl ester carboxylesterase
MPKAQINGITLYYEVHGQGPAVVFAHGAGGNHLSWWQQVPVLARQYRCISFDHRGFGQSLDAPNGPGSQAFVEDLKGLLDYLEIERASLVAQSMGDVPAWDSHWPIRSACRRWCWLTPREALAMRAWRNYVAKVKPHWLGQIRRPARMRVISHRSSRPRPFSMSKFVRSIRHATRRQSLGRPSSRSAPCRLPHC